MNDASAARAYLLPGRWKRVGRLTVGYLVFTDCGLPDSKFPANSATVFISETQVVVSGTEKMK
jgi:hypothetical protein